MGDFAIVGEGITDQIVLRSLILAYHDDRDLEPEVVFEQPPFDTTGAAGLDPEPGGWTLVVNYLRERKYLQALQLNRYVVVQIDTDIANDLGVVRPPSATDEALIELVVEKLYSYVAEEDRPVVRDRLLFAIGLDEIECWLLSAVFDPSEKARLTKTTGCLEAIDLKLAKQNLAPLSKPSSPGKKRSKDLRRYREVCRKFRRRKDIAAIGNPGFVRFVRDLASHPLDDA